VIPRPAAVALIASSPLMIAAWALPGGFESAGLDVAAVSAGLVTLGSLPAALGVLRHTGRGMMSG
jgi:hypothetical protein